MCPQLVPDAQKGAGRWDSQHKEENRFSQQLDMNYKRL
jgi:hypothetical protein